MQACGGLQLDICVCGKRCADEGGDLGLSLALVGKIVLVHRAPGVSNPSRGLRLESSVMDCENTLPTWLHRGPRPDLARQSTNGRYTSRRVSKSDLCGPPRCTSLAGSCAGRENASQRKEI
jgi:hypothetical protein